MQSYHDVYFRQEIITSRTMKERLLLAFTLLCLCQPILAQNQKFLVIDRYGMKRIKFAEGDKIWFSLKKDGKYRYKDVIGELRDSTMYLAKRKTFIKLSEISAFYFTNGFSLWFTGGSYFVGTGFLFSAAVHPLISNAQYDQKESAIIGASFLALGQLVRLFRRRKFKVTDNTRIRILDLSFSQPATHAGK